MISLAGITKQFGQHVVLHDIELTIEQGSFTAIIGRSGSGKSTLLRIMGGMLPPTQGEVTYDGTVITALSDRERAAFRNRRIGFVFQDHFLEPMLSVYQNVELPLMIGGRRPDERREIIEEMLTLVGMADKKDRKVCKLSGGEQQRVAIARSIVMDPDVLLADEPCGSLDTENAQNVMHLFRSLTDLDKTVIMVTHHIWDIQTADRVVTIQDGRIVRDETH